MPRVGEPEEIATEALFLSLGESAFINGQVITADGGWSSYKEVYLHIGLKQINILLVPALNISFRMM
jgi:hypothetical protein